MPLICRPPEFDSFFSVVERTVSAIPIRAILMSLNEGNKLLVRALSEGFPVDPPLNIRQNVAHLVLANSPWNLTAAES